MNNKEHLSSLINSHKFDEAYKFVKDSGDESLLFYSLLALLGKGEYKKVIEEILLNEETLLKYEPLKTIRLHIKTLVFLDEFIAAYRTLEHYRNRPYISQEIEEEFPILEKFIIEEEADRKKENKKVDIEEVKQSFINASNDLEIYASLANSLSFPFAKISEAMKHALINGKLSQEVRSLVLAHFIDNNYENEVEFLSYKGLIKIVPNDFENPQRSPLFQRCVAYIDQFSNHDISIKKNALNIFNMYVLVTFPDDIYMDNESLAKAVIYLAKKYMGINDINTPDNILTLANDIEKIIS